ncbi:YihY/virulence factor BrkB family protein [Chlamydiifrater volucris]|uniref:YihY/virulence factor BrkB family protein n=1 Tax=Chlamydiifrater volucris TaxID=2681470 RepID=UPI0032B2A399
MLKKIRSLFSSSTKNIRSFKNKVSPIESIKESRFIRVIKATISTVFYCELPREAAILSYYGVLTIIPILVFFFRLSEKLFANADLQKFLIEKFPNYASQIKEIGITALEASDSGTGIVLISSFFVFCWAGLLMLSSLEDGLNKISGNGILKVSGNRLLAYLGIILVSPMIFILSYGSFIYATKILPLLNPSFLPLTTSQYVLKLFYSTLPYFVICPTLFLCYYFLPRTKVLSSAAWISSAVIGIIYVSCQHWFLIMQIKLFNYSFTYGALVALPSFLLLLYFCSFLFLVGGALTFSIQNLGYKFFSRHNPLLEGYEKTIVCLEILIMIMNRFNRGTCALTANDISKSTRIPLGEITQCLDILVERELITGFGEKRNQQKYLPAFNFNEITVLEVLKKIIGANGNMKHKTSIAGSAAEESLKKIMDSLQHDENNVTVLELTQNF